MEYFITTTTFGNVSEHMLLTRNNGVFYNIECKQVSFDPEILQTAFEKGWIVEVTKEGFKQLHQISDCLYHANLACYEKNTDVYNKAREVVNMLSSLYHEACCSVITKGISQCS